MSDLLIDIFAEILEIDSEEINDETSPENTPQWDSLAAMHLVSAIEENFEVELSTSEIMKMRSVGIIREVLKQKGITIL